MDVPRSASVLGTLDLQRVRSTLGTNGSLFNGSTTGLRAPRSPDLVHVAVSDGPGLGGNAFGGNKGIAPTTPGTYNTGQKAWSQFCTQIRLDCREYSVCSLVATRGQPSPSLPGSINHRRAVIGNLHTQRGRNRTTKDCEGEEQSRYVQQKRKTDTSFNATDCSFWEGAPIVLSP